MHKYLNRDKCFKVWNNKYSFSEGQRQEVPNNILLQEAQFNRTELLYNKSRVSDYLWFDDEVKVLSL